MHYLLFLSRFSPLLRCFYGVTNADGRTLRQNIFIILSFNCNRRFMSSFIAFSGVAFPYFLIWLHWICCWCKCINTTDSKVDNLLVCRVILPLPFRFPLWSEYSLIRDTFTALLWTIISLLNIVAILLNTL